MSVSRKSQQEEAKTRTESALTKRMEQLTQRSREACDGSSLELRALGLRAQAHDHPHHQDHHRSKSRLWR